MNETLLLVLLIVCSAGVQHNACVRELCSVMALVIQSTAGRHVYSERMAGPAKSFPVSTGKLGLTYARSDMRIQEIYSTRQSAFPTGTWPLS